MTRYAHCRHCCWGNPHHPDDAPTHDTPCSSGCAPADPLPEPEPVLAGLFDLDTQETR